MVISDQEKKRKKSGFMEEGTVGRSSERLESGLPPKLMEDFVPMVPFFFLIKFKVLFNIFKVYEMREPCPFMSSIYVILDPDNLGFQLF